LRVERDHRFSTTDATRFIESALPCIEEIERGAWRLTANRYDAEDLVQETLLNAYNGFHTFGDGTNMRAWLFRIMRNTWISGYRSRRRGPVEQLCEDFTDAQLSSGLRHAAAGPQSAEAEALAGLRNDVIADALQAIPEANRIVVYYADVEGYHYREIASLMGTPIGTVMSRLARGRARLRELLADHATQPTGRAR
jgi:RNA polymerase sigma-70 factor (ECF subfamily)